ncbi:MAG: crossover junction endodeoxyribonuclease RuvC [Alphaproteobacteria bacterium]|nr:crossover junction endodeoxyribonuclease RuvC [Alphaproteobacteria bacterium]
MSARIILGVDPGLNRCGWGVIIADGSRLSHVAHGVVRPDASASLAFRLAELSTLIEAVTLEHAPHDVAMEETYVNANARAALALGQARGAALAACARTGRDVAEYAPATIKKALVGNGQAQKDQVAFMVRRLLPAAGAVTADAADALACALCHAAHGAWRSKVG